MAWPMRRANALVVAALGMVLTSSADASEPVVLYAAGSLRGALTEVAEAFAADAGIKVEAKYGPSGTLRDEISAGSRAQVFASANMDHPQSLAAAKLAIQTFTAEPQPDDAVNVAAPAGGWDNATAQAGAAKPAAKPAKRAARVSAAQ